MAHPTNTPAEAVAAVHALGLRGCLSDLPAGTDPADVAGFAVSTPAGWMLTADGRTAFEARVRSERSDVDLERLAVAYARFLTVNTELKSLCSNWHGADEAERELLLLDLEDIIERVQPALARCALLVSRFGVYAPRLQEALDRARSGDTAWVLDPRVDSVHTVWMELHEDLLKLQGISREDEGSY